MRPHIDEGPSGSPLQVNRGGVKVGGKNGKLKDCSEENMHADGVPLLKDYDTYQASLPVRELGIDPPLKLYQLPFYVRECYLDGFATSLTRRMQRPTVAYVTAASHSGKSASVVVGFLRSRELDSGDDARLNFTHYVYMPFANNDRNYHVDEEQLVSGCGKSSKLREALGATYMRGCFRETFDSDYVDGWHLPNATPTFRTSCLRRTSPPSCNAVQRACFSCTWMSTGLCAQTQTSGEVP